MAIRAAHIGTGNVGRLALAELISNPAFELTGSAGPQAHPRSPQEVGAEMAEAREFGSGCLIRPAPIPPIADPDDAPEPTRPTAVFAVGSVG